MDFYSKKVQGKLDWSICGHIMNEIRLLLFLQPKEFLQKINKKKKKNNNGNSLLIN
jgi:hypothetical protein